MKKILLMVAMCLVLPFLGSCDTITLERQVFAICMSVDVTEDGQLLLTIQSPLGSPSTGVSDNAAGAEGYDIVAAQAEGLFEALHKIEAAIPFPLNFSQLRILILSAEVAGRYDLRPLLLDVFRFTGTRSNACVLVAQGSGTELLHAQKSSFGLRLSTHLDTLIKNLRASGYMPHTTLATCLKTIGSGRRDPLLSLGVINPTLQAAADEKKKGTPGSAGQESTQGESSKKKEEGGGSSAVFAEGGPVLHTEETAGFLLMQGTNPVELGGAAITSDGVVVGYLTIREMVMYNHLLLNAELRYAIDGESLQLQLILKDESDIERYYDEMLAVVTKLQYLRSDAFGFGGLVAQAFYTDGEWNAYGFAERYPTAQVYIGVER